MQLDECLAETDSLAALDAAWDAAWQATDPDLLSLCRDRVAILLRHRPTLDAMSDERHGALVSSNRNGLTDVERAVLDFTEQYVIDVASLSDAQVEAVRGHLGDEGLADFVNALLVVEQRMSLETIFDGVL